MKDSEFIELLNLYLDHEISAADAARLEAEVLKNPARRHVYQDYCRMQKACKLLAQDFVEEAAPAPANVVAFEAPDRASRVGWLAGGTFAAAAACLAVVFVSMNRDTTPPSQAQPKALAHEQSVVIPSETLASSVDRSVLRSVTVPPILTRGETPVVSAVGLSLASASSSPAIPTERFVSSADPTAPQFAWMNTVQLAPMQRASLDDFRSTNRVNATPPVRAQAGAQPPTEWVVIRWQKR